MAGFPAGTVSGAPKIRAMQIIDQLENECRGIYAGGIGYISSEGDMDTCIVLRTGIIKGNKLYVQAGGGVVYDSDPELEYQETVPARYGVADWYIPNYPNASKRPSTWCCDYLFDETANYNPPTGVFPDYNWGQKCPIEQVQPHNEPPYNWKPLYLVGGLALYLV